MTDANAVLGPIYERFDAARLAASFLLVPRFRLIPTVRKAL
jgi:hypothetical protein